MGELWDVLKPALPGVVVALVGLGGTLWVALSNQRAAQRLAGVNADHTLRTQRTIERDKSARERRSRRIDALVEQLRTEVEQLIAFQSALEAGDPARFQQAAEALTQRSRRSVLPAVSTVPVPEVRTAFRDLSAHLERAHRLVAQAGMQQTRLTNESFNTVMLPILRSLADLDRLVDEYVLGPEP